MSDDSKIEAKPIGIWPSLQRTARFNQPVETPISMFFYVCLHTGKWRRQWWEPWQFGKLRLVKA